MQAIVHTALKINPFLAAHLEIGNHVASSHPLGSEVPSPLTKVERGVLAFPKRPCESHAAKLSKS